MRIIAGRWRGRRLEAPKGEGTRPTLDRVRQALFDRLWHAPWAGRKAIEGASVLDAFAGSGALGLEALSRGAARAVFLDTDPAARRVIQANLRACGAEAQVLAADATRPPKAPWQAGLVFLDPPYAQGLVARALAALGEAGWIAPGALVVVEQASSEPGLAPPGFAVLDERAQGPARVTVLRAP